MPLRVRLIVVVGLVLLASLACGSTLVAWRAAGQVRTELSAALDVGTKTIRNGFDDLPVSGDRPTDLRHLIATFDGNRHVRAELLDARDRPEAASTLVVPAEPAPRWFLGLIGGGLASVRLSVPQAGDGGAIIVLQPDPTNEATEVWEEARDTVLILGGFALLSGILIFAAVSHALRPLENVSIAFERVGKGDYGDRLAEHGAPELARLANGFNRMTQRLATAAMQNRRLHERLLALQAEERADLARDLHDEIGPLLFAVEMTAATIERLAHSGRGADISTHVRSIHDAVDRMQRYVRAILERLRALHTLGLEVAIDRLVAFWRSRRPEIAFIFNISLEEDRTGDDVKETIYRVVQEAVSNAIRHGQPTRVEIAVSHDAQDDICAVVTDDGIGMTAAQITEQGRTQFGLAGMRERVTAMSGSLLIRPGHGGKGLAVVASVPCSSSLQACDQDVLE